MLFDVKKPIDYYVEADGVRSPTYTMKVVELPAVGKLELEYVFPAYTGLRAAEGRVGRRRRGAPRHRSARARSRRRWRRRPGSCSSIRARRRASPRRPDGTLTGSFKMDKDGFYQIELDGPHGENVTASPKYTVDVIEDQPPTVTFEKPKRDTSARTRSKKCSCRRAPTTTSA